MGWTEAFTSMTSTDVSSPTGGGAGTPVAGSAVDYHRVMNDHAAVCIVTWDIDPAGSTALFYLEGSLDNANWYTLSPNAEGFTTGLSIVGAGNLLGVCAAQPARYARVAAQVNSSDTATAVATVLLTAHE